MKWLRRLLCRHPQLIVCSNAVHCGHCSRRWRGGMDSTELIGVDVGALMDSLAESRELAEAFRYSASEFAQALSSVRPSIPTPSEN